MALINRLVLTLASSYIAGKNGKDALSTAHASYNQNKFTGTFDVLGEAASSPEQCQQNVEQHLNFIDLVSNHPLPVQDKQKQLSISFKSSTFCASPNAGKMPSQSSLDEGYARIAQVVEYGFKKNILMSLDAEDHRWADFEMATYSALLDKGYSNLGAVLQTRLFRTKEDIKRLDERGRVRLVIGIYEESNEVAYTEKKQMKELLITYSRQLLEKGAYVELATHDQDYVKKFFTDVVFPMRLTPDKFETQFLYGVPRLKLQKMLVSGEYFVQWQAPNNNLIDQSYLETFIQSGCLVRLYLPFGADDSAGPYCKRRLRENPSLYIYGLKNLLGIQ